MIKANAKTEKALYSYTNEKLIKVEVVYYFIIDFK